MSNVIEITDFSAPELDVYARLTEAQLLNRFEPKKGMFIAESPKVIIRALDAGCVPVSLLVERNHINDEAAQAIERCPNLKIICKHGVGLDNIHVNKAKELGIDCIAIGNIERFKNAPKLMSPISYFPKAKSVIAIAMRVDMVRHYIKLIYGIRWSSKFVFRSFNILFVRLLNIVTNLVGY